MARDIIYPNKPGTVTVDGFPGHFVSARKCGFRLHHHIMALNGKRYRVSTVGAYHANRNSDGYEPLSAYPESFYETAVFVEQEIDNGFVDVDDWTEIDKCFNRDSISATQTHLEFVERYRTIGTGNRSGLSRATRCRARIWHMTARRLRRCDVTDWREVAILYDERARNNYVELMGCEAEAANLRQRLTRNYAARRRLIRERNEERRKRRALEAALPIIWRAFDGLYGAKHKEPIPYDSLPKDRQKLFDAALDALAELNEEDAND